MIYEGKFIINGKGYRKRIEANSATEAKQKILESINFISCEPVASTTSLKSIEDIFGMFSKLFGKK